jgi:Holliday junction resolvase RusA-like endonuclease
MNEPHRNNHKNSQGIYEGKVRDLENLTKGINDAGQYFLNYDLIAEIAFDQTDETTRLHVQ